MARVRTREERRSSGADAAGRGQTGCGGERRGRTPSARDAGGHAARNESAARSAGRVREGAQDGSKPIQWIVWRGPGGGVGEATRESADVLHATHQELRSKHGAAGTDEGTDGVGVGGQESVAGSQSRAVLRHCLWRV